MATLITENPSEPEGNLTFPTRNSDDMDKSRSRILIVDDEVTNIHVLLNILNEQYTVVAATSGEKALQLAARQPQPSLILLDIKMPEMDGYEVLRRLKANPDTADIPVIFISALSEYADEALGLRMGAADYITKPVNPVLLLLRIRTQLELHRFHRKPVSSNQKNAHRSRMNLLIVSDDSIENNLLIQALSAEYSVVTARTGGRVLEIVLSANAPDLILLDIALPDTDGYEVCRRIKSTEAGNRIPVIFLGAIENTAEKVRGFSIGAADFITRPFEIDEVRARVRTHLELSRLQLYFEQEVAQQTSALKEALNKLQATFDAIPDLILEIGLDGRYHDFHAPDNERQVFQAKQLLGGSLSTVMPGEAARILMSAIARAHDSGSASGEYEIDGAGGKRAYHFSVSRKTVTSGEEARFILVSRNITSLKQYEADLLTQNHLGQILLELPLIADELDEIAFIQRALEMTEDITGSLIAFLHHVNDDEVSIEMFAWSRRTLEKYCRAAYEKHYPVSQAGIWADALRLRRPVIFNDYNRISHKKGLPEGHANLDRLISVPVLESGKVVMLVGVGNKTDKYTPQDMHAVQLIANAVWRIVQRNRGRKLLVKNEQHFRAVTESASDAIITSDINGSLIKWNAAAEHLFGYAPDEIALQQLPALMPERFRYLHNQGLARVASGAEPHVIGKTVELAGLRKDGSEFPMELSLSQWKSDDGQYFTAIIRDISERKQAENQLRKLALAVEQSPESIIISNLNAEIEYVNENFLRTSGYSREEVIGRNPRIIQSGNTPRETYVSLWKNLTQGLPWKGEVYNKRKDGSDYIELAIITPLRQVDGRITHYVSIQEDITDKKRMEAELNTHHHNLESLVELRTAELTVARQRADAANRSKSEFLATMSHEIRTPMNGVIGMIEVLRQSDLSTTQMDMANIVQESAFSLLTIINDILDFSKIEAGKLQIDSEPLCVAKVVEMVCLSLNPMAQKSGAELRMFVDPALPDHVLGDAGRIRQILVNLLNNAIKFSTRHLHGKVLVRAKLLEQTEDNIVFQCCISDNGIGMDRDTQERLFSPFTQADTSTTRNYGGTGLGLVISLQLAQLMGGRINVKSELGKGATFCVTLPLVLPKEKFAPDMSFSSISSLSCLVVGIENSEADDLADYLHHGGATISRVADPIAAETWLAGRTPGLYVVVMVENAKPIPIDKLRASAKLHPGLDVRFVILKPGLRSRCVLLATDLVELDAEIIHRRAFLEAVMISAGLAKLPEIAERRSDIRVKSQLTREEARQLGRLILVAEDNVVNQKVILHQLALLGHTADIASNGLEAFKRWQSGDYAVLFADLHMPEMDGYELTSAIRKAENNQDNIKRLPIIAFTANALKGENEHCLEIGMDDYLSKPVQLESLRKILEKWLSFTASPVNQDTTPASGMLTLSSDGKGNIIEAVPLSPVPPPTPSGQIDFNVLKELVGDNEAILHEVFEDYRESSTSISASLQESCRAGDAQSASKLAHKLKSSSRSVGALALGDLCERMEQAGKANDKSTLMELLPQFETELAAVLQLLK